MIYEKGEADFVTQLTDQVVKAAASTGISSLANGAIASFSLDTADLSGVDWGRLHPIVLVDYRTGAGYYDTLQAVFEYSPAPFEIKKYADPETVAAGDTLTYTLQVINTSETNLDFTVTDTLPDEVTYHGSTVWPSPFSISPGSIWQTTFMVTVSDTYNGDPFTNIAIVTNTHGADTQDSIVVNEMATGGGGGNKIYFPIILVGGPDPGPWQVVIEEDFEGSFPGLWDVDDNGEGYQWAKRDCKAYEGNNSGWVVGGGALGAGLACGEHKVTDTLNTTMAYGPFSLTNAGEAQLNFKYWFNTDVSDPGNLWFCANFSTNGTIFLEESCIYGNSGGWRDATFDLAKYGLLEKDQVWVQIVAYYPYTPDLTLMDGGIFIDDVVVRKR
jgi:uncharacterized repeat protein (TIGR01451 family)